MNEKVIQPECLQNCPAIGRLERALAQAVLRLHDLSSLDPFLAKLGETQEERKREEEKAISDLQMMLDTCARCPGPNYEVTDDYTGPICQAPFEEIPFDY